MDLIHLVFSVSMIYSQPFFCPCPLCCICNLIGGSQTRSRENIIALSKPNQIVPTKIPISFAMMLAAVFPFCWA
jgi:hypothetical protein